MKIKPFELSLAFLFVTLAILVGWFVGADATNNRSSEKSTEDSQKAPLLTQPSPTNKNSQNTPKKSLSDNNLDNLLALPKERLVRFDTDEDYQRFLASLEGSNVRLLGSLDRLRAVRLGFNTKSDLDDLLGDEEQFFNNLVTLPLNPGEGSIQPGAVPFDGNALSFLGINGDNSTWGEGVTIAVIDSGITAHEALPENITHFDFVDDGSTSALHGHGTAVASLIAGQNQITPGVAPAADLIDIRVANSNGNSSSFQLAEGIFQAVDAGANILNISLGSYSDSGFVQDAIEYAVSQGVAIVASSGNEGFTQAAFPAAYPNVVTVGAVDSEGTLVDFSNTGAALDITAPGLEVFSAWTDDRYIEFTGTSASAPYVAGAIAAGISEFGLTPTQSIELVIANTNEAGLPGSDLSYGSGNLDVGRIVNSQTPGINDLAAVSNFLSDSRDTMTTVVQNQGTTTIRNATATLNTPFEQIPLTIPSLAPGEIQTFEFTSSFNANSQTFTMTTSTALEASINDTEPSNNTRSTSFDLVPSE